MDGTVWVADKEQEADEEEVVEEEEDEEELLEQLLWLWLLAKTMVGVTETEVEEGQLSLLPFK